MPIRRTVAPITETITRLTTLIFSTFQKLRRRFVHEGESIDCLLGATYHLTISSRATRADGVGGGPISLLSWRVNGQEEVPASA